MPRAPARSIRPMAAGATHIPPGIFRLFFLLLIFSIFNPGGVYTYRFSSSIPLNPIFFVAIAAIILPFTNSQQKSVYFVFAWFYWVIFALGGFVGSEQVTGISLYAVAQPLIKIWITLVGFPWLAIRSVSRENLPWLVKGTYIMIAIGAVFALAQVRWPGIFPDIVAAEGRGSGFWINPNNCGVLSVIALFMNLLFPFKNRFLNYAFRALFLLGVIGSMSRAALLVLGGTSLVYGIAQKRFVTVIASIVFVFLFAATGIYIIEKIPTAVPQKMRPRIEAVKAFMQGDISDKAQSKTTSRTETWRISYEKIQQAPFFGHGHGSMNTIVHHHFGPHNTYLYIWGTSGFPALLAFLTLLLTLAWLAWNCPDANYRSGLIAIVAGITVQLFFVHSMLDNQFIGAVISVIVVMIYHCRTMKKEDGQAPPQLRRPVLQRR